VKEASELQRLVAGKEEAVKKETRVARENRKDVWGLEGRKRAGAERFDKGFLWEKGGNTEGGGRGTR